MDKSKIVVVIYDNLEEKYASVRQNFLDLLKFRLNVGRDIDTVIETKSITTTLIEYTEKNFEWAVVISIASYINDISLCITTVEEAIQKKSPLIGHILDKGGYYHLHPQWFALNLLTFKQLNYPPLEETSSPITIETLETERCLDNVHDDYTPLWIKPKSNTIMTYQSDRGYFAINLISEMIKHNYTVVNLSDDIRNRKNYSYVEYCYDEVVEFINDPTNEPTDKSKPFYWFAKNLTNIKSLLNVGYYVVNTEDLIENKYEDKLDRFVGVCGGIKPSCIAGSDKFSDDTKVFLFDVSDAAIEWQKFLIQNWDGSIETFGSIWNNFRNKNQSYKPLHFMHESIDDTLKNFFNKVNLTHDEFKIRWQRYQKMTHDFRKLNVLEDDAANQIASLVNDGIGAYVWTSNCFRMDYLSFFKTDRWGEERLKHFNDSLSKSVTVPTLFENQCWIEKLK